VPEAIHPPERDVVRGEKVCPIGEYREKEAVGNSVAEERPDACPRGGETFDEGEDSLRKGYPVAKVVGGREGGGEPGSKPSNYPRGAEEVVL